MAIVKVQPLYQAKVDTKHPIFAKVTQSIVSWGNAHRWQRNSGLVIPNPSIGGALNVGITSAGSSFDLNGSSNYLDYGVVDVGDEFTLFFGVQFDALSGVTGIVDSSNGSTNGWSLFTSSTDIYLSGNHYSGDLLASGWATGQHYHVAVRNKAGVGKDIFRNGVNIATSATALSAVSSPVNNFWVGRLRVSSPQYLNGNLTYFYLVNKYVSDALIKNINGNPWQIFEEEPEFFFPPATSGLTLVVANTSSADAVSVPAITQDHQLALASAVSNSAASNVILSQTHQLSAASLTSSDLVDTVAISVSGSINLVVAGLNSADAVSAIALTQDHQLALLSASSAPTISAIALSQNHQLGVASLSSASAVGTVAITLNGVTLVLADCVSACLLDPVIITQEHLFTWIKDSSLSFGWTKDSSTSNVWS